MRKGIISAGNWVVDTVKFIPTYPSQGNLVTIEKMSTGFGGCSHNVLADIARMKTGIPLYAGGCIGNDSHGDAIMETLRELGIDSSCMHRTEMPTSFTDVMADKRNGTRTFFHFRGANSQLDQELISQMKVPAKIFHLGYLLLLDKLDEEDGEYGTKAARALHDLQEEGYKTSVDVVSEEGNRFRKIVLPSLPYIDYLIINEVEAGSCYGESLRDDNGKIVLERVKEAARYLIDKGVGSLCAIHFPEGGYALMKHGNEFWQHSCLMPASQIVSSVGAGDAFCAGMLYAIHEDLPLSEALKIASTSAYFNLKSATSTDGAPEWKQIKDFIEKNYR